MDDEINKISITYKKLFDKFRGKLNTNKISDFQEQDLKIENKQTGYSNFLEKPFLLFIQQGNPEEKLMLLSGSRSTSKCIQDGTFYSTIVFEWKIRSKLRICRKF